MTTLRKTKVFNLFRLLYSQVSYTICSSKVYILSPISESPPPDERDLLALPNNSTDHVNRFQNYSSPELYLNYV